jgi:ribonuclease P protein component
LGQRIRARFLDVKRLDSPRGHARVAIVVPKFGFTVVQRNKLKRRLRELTRQHVLPHAGSCDLLVRARRDAYDAGFDRLREEIHHVAAQLR